MIRPVCGSRSIGARDSFGRFVRRGIVGVGARRFLVVRGVRCLPLPISRSIRWCCCCCLGIFLVLFCLLFLAHLCILPSVSLFGQSLFSKALAFLVVVILMSRRAVVFLEVGCHIMLQVHAKDSRLATSSSQSSLLAHTELSVCYSFFMSS